VFENKAIKNRISIESFIYMIEFIRRRFFALCFTSSPFVLVAFWVLVYYPGYNIQASTIVLHGITFVLLFVEFIISTMIISVFDIITVFCGICLYEAYGLFKYFVTGTWIYSFLDPNINGNYGITVVYFFLVPVIYMMIFIVIFFFIWVRNIIAGIIKLRLFKIEEQIDDKDYELSGNENLSSEEIISEKEELDKEELEELEPIN